MHTDSNDWEIRLKPDFCLCFVNKTQKWIGHSPDFTRLTRTLWEEAFFSITAALQLGICLCACVFLDSTWSNATKPSSPLKFSLENADTMLLLFYCDRKFSLSQEPDVQVVIIWFFPYQHASSCHPDPPLSYWFYHLRFGDASHPRIFIFPDIFSFRRCSCPGANSSHGPYIDFSFVCFIPLKTNKCIQASGNKLQLLFDNYNRSCSSYTQWKCKSRSGSIVMTGCIVARALKNSQV